MEISIVSQERDKVELGMRGGTHTCCNYLRKELWNDSATKIAGYNIEHSLTGYPVLILETDEKSDTKKILQKAVERLKKQNKELRDQFKKVLK